jgi:diadenosine tetraphosphate (Ap4A) HIT family hydrolase
VPETEHGVRFFQRKVADGYLQLSGPTPGYCVVVFRRRHVGDPQSMTAEEHGDFWTSVGEVAGAIEAVYDPIHLNFQILGNQGPHVHVQVVPRPGSVDAIAGVCVDPEHDAERRRAD